MTKNSIHFTPNPTESYRTRLDIFDGYFASQPIRNEPLRNAKHRLFPSGTQPNRVDPKTPMHKPITPPPLQLTDRSNTRIHRRANYIDTRANETHPTPIAPFSNQAHETDYADQTTSQLHFTAALKSLCTVPLPQFEFRNAKFSKRLEIALKSFAMLFS